MKREEYLAALNEIRDPYAVWIRENEGRKGKERPENQGLFMDRSPRGRGVSASPGSVFRFKPGPLLSEWADRYVFFLREGDGADPSLPELLRKYLREEDFDFIYGDEDIADPFRRDPWFKPGWSPDTIRSFYYPGGFTMVSWRLFSETAAAFGAGRGSEVPEEEREYPLELLRECALRAEKRLHIPSVIFHGAEECDYSYRNVSLTEKEPGREAGAAPEDGGENETAAAGAAPDIAVVILSKDHPGLLQTCVSTLFRAAEAEGLKLETVVVDNGSTPENAARYEELSGEYGFGYHPRPMPFLYSRLCNLGAALTAGSLLLFLNDDVEVPEGTRFLRGMAEMARKPHVGAVGCRLLYPGGNLIQHCGITLLRTGPSHKLCGYPDDRDYYHGVNRTDRDVFAVTGACLMVRREVFRSVGGFDEGLAVAFTDVDLCADFLERGLFNVCLGGFALIHHESLTREDDVRDASAYERLRKERQFFREKHRELLKEGDPFYSVNLTDTGLDYRVKVASPEEKIPVAGELSPVSPEMIRRLKKGDRRFRMNLESAAYRLNDACGNEDYFEFRGWAYLAGAPGWKYEPLLLLKKDGRWYQAETCRTERRDLPEVFPDERDLCLSGFLVRAARDSLEGGIEAAAAALVKPGLFRKNSLTGFMEEAELPEGTAAALSAAVHGTDRSGQ